MGNHLHGSPLVFAASFSLDHSVVHLARCDTGIDRELFVDESFIMPEIEVGFAAVFCHKHLPVLIRADRSRVHIDIRVHFLHKHRQAAVFQKAPEARAADPFSDTGNHPACHKNILGHLLLRFQKK